MRTLPTLVTAALTLMLAAPLAAAPRIESLSPEAALSKGSNHGMQLAQGKKKRKAGGGGAAKGVREKYISREAVVKGKDSTKVDFDAADIGGQRKTPMGTLIGQSKADKNYDFVKIRLRWHPEMIQSASALDAGDTQ